MQFCSCPVSYKPWTFCIWLYQAIADNSSTPAHFEWYDYDDNPVMLDRVEGVALEEMFVFNCPNLCSNVNQGPPRDLRALSLAEIRGSLRAKLAKKEG